MTIDSGPDAARRDTYTNGRHQPKPETSTMPIAIIGMACRLGGDASSPSKLWEMCTSARDAWSPIPQERFNAKALYHPNRERVGRNHAVGGYFLNEDVALFDAGFFNFSGDVASAMDPQIRLLLETVYETLEDAGIPLEKIASTDTSVFTGCYGKDYHDLHTRDPEQFPASFLTGNGTAVLSNRISHFFDLQGASMSIDTGCSAGMVALHQACQTIRSGQSSMSVVGATSTMLNPDLFVIMSTLGLIGADGKCYAWDSRAEGYGRGEGVAAFLLKPLDEALKDGDHIHAVIRETGLNQDGKTTTITSPSVESQVKLIQDCYERAGLDLSDTGYVEAHMTGTKTGDLAEAQALARTFGASREPGDSVLVGSIKTNIGHTEPVSGLAALIKAVFAVETGVVPPNLNYDNPNPTILLKEWNLQVPTSLTAWPSDKPRRASINNFGYGGSNSHAIIERAPAVSRKSDRNVVAIANGHHHQNGNNHAEEEDPARIYFLSAKDSTAAQGMANRFSEYLRDAIKKGNAPSAEDLAYTLANRRSRLPWTTAVSARSLEELADRWANSSVAVTQSSKHPRLGFVFNGQGAQWFAMGRELIGAYPVFRSSLEKADQLLRSLGASWSLRDELMRDSKTTRVGEINLSQPISVALQMCLVDLLKSWDITPSAVTSHSSGEIAAAYAVGLLSFSEALAVVYYRGELARKHQKLASVSGGMLAAGVSRERAESYISNTSSGRVVVACVNSPGSVTLSGDMDGIDEVAALLEKDGLFARKLKVPLAYHSHHMLSMAQDYTDALEKTLSTANPTWNKDILFASPVTGKVETTADVFTPEHWVRNLTSPVLFSQAFEDMCFYQETQSPTSHSRNVDMVLEIGAHSTLEGPIRQILGERKLPYASCLKRSVNAVETMQNLAGELLGEGYGVSLEAINFPRGGSGTFVPGLPTYAWNHSTRYWLEPRINREIRQQSLPPHELLGTILPGSNGLYPTWRNFLRLSDVAWLVDHQLDSNIVLPGAGYVAMAIEAIRLLQNSDGASVTGYHVRDVDILSALIIPESGTTGVEIQFSLRPCSGKVSPSNEGFYEFELSSPGPRDTWIVNCHGYVSVETTEAPAPLNLPEEGLFFPNGSKIQNIEAKTVFAGLREMGLYHGPIFQNLYDSRVAAKKAVTDMVIAPVASEADEYILHPTTLDSIIQATYNGLPKASRQGFMVIPRAIKSLFVPRGFKRHGGDRLQAFSELQQSAKTGFTSSVTVRSIGDAVATSAIHIEGFFAQAVPRGIIDDSKEETPSICYKSVWEQDITHGVNSSSRETMKIELSDQERDFERKLIRASYHSIHDAVAELEGEEQSGWEWHHKIYYGWMKEIVAQASRGELAPNSARWAKSGRGMKLRLIDELNAGDASGKLVVRVGQKLADIVRGHITPLELMMEGGLLNEYYMALPRLENRSYHHLAQIVQLYAAKEPGANILEIGAGTGGATGTVLGAFEAKSHGPGTLVGSYTFTDISSGFFEAARRKLTAWSGILDFKKLNIESDPLDQSFTSGSYDLIVASMVLHATKSLDRTMSHVRRLLKPTGKLLLIEATQDSLDSQLIFGTLPGWWLSEEPDRKMSPNASLEVWDTVLKRTGFSGVQFEIGDCEEKEFQSTSIILTSAVPDSKYPTSISIIHNEQSSADWLDRLGQAIQAETQVNPTIETIDDIKPDGSTVYIVASELSRSFVENISESSFTNLQKLLVNSRGTLWLTQGSVVDAEQPLFEQISGLLRTLRQEDSGSRHIRLDFELDAEELTDSHVRHVVEVFQQGFDFRVAPTDLEWEYGVKDGVRYVPRVYPNGVQDAEVLKDWTVPTPVLASFQAPQRTLVWSAEALSEAHFAEVADNTDLPEGMVEVEAKAFGLNHRDISSAENTLVGHDFAGIVKRLGPSVENSDLRIGDRVAGIAQGSFANKAQALYTSVAKIPESVGWAEAAALPSPFIAAYYALISLAALQSGESVLIQDAASDVGQAAIVVSQKLGATIFTLSKSSAEAEHLTKTHHLAAGHNFSKDDTGLSAIIGAQTDGLGVHVVFNALSGPLVDSTWDCVRRFGRYVDLNGGSPPSSKAAQKCATYSTFDVLQVLEYRGSAAQAALVEGIRISHERTEVPILPLVTWPISDLDRALTRLEGQDQLGKIVVVPGENDQVKILPRPNIFSLDDTNSTYLIVGGLGGIAYTVASWMLQKGAKHLVILSRHAAQHPKAAELQAVAKSQGSALQIRSCDASNEGDLLAHLAEVSQSFPPIKGVINGAMVLEDSIWERMTHTQWQRAVAAKVAVTTNLDRSLSNLSFFILLSSLTGVIGSASQANYAAGGAFQDSLARHRTANSLPAVALDLSAVESVGFVAETGDDARQHIERLGSDSVSIETVLQLIEAAIRDPLRQSPAESQVIVGLTLWDRLAEDTATRRDRRFSTLRVGSKRATADAGISSGDEAGGSNSSAALIRKLAEGNLAATEAQGLFLDVIAGKLASIFNIDAAGLDREAPLAQFGVDSLVAVDLRNWLGTSVKAKVSIFEILQSPSLREFASFVAQRSEWMSRG